MNEKMYVVRSSKKLSKKTIKMLKDEWERLKEDGFICSADDIYMIGDMCRVIRCKDCTYYQEDSHECGMEIDWFYMPDDGFCSRGERREE